GAPGTGPLAPVAHDAGADARPGRGGDPGAARRPRRRGALRALARRGHGVSSPAVPGADSADALRELIDRYNDAWNRQDADAIMSMHTPELVLHKHTTATS